MGQTNTNPVLRVKEFTWAVFAPGLHITFAVVWFLGLEGALVFLHGSDRIWEFDSRSVINMISILLVLFYLRVVDEIKDYEYDKVYNPDRPLVLGIVTFTELWVYLGVIAISVILLNLTLSYSLVFILVVDMAYALFLIWLEKVSLSVRNSMFLNLLVTYPVNIALSIYIYVSFIERYKAVPDLPGIFMICACACAFLNYEIGRKTSWAKDNPKGQRLYSNEIGIKGAALLWVILGVSTCSILLENFQPWEAQGIFAVTGWLIIFLILPVCQGVYHLWWERSGFSQLSKETRLTRYGFQFLSMFYIFLVIYGFIGNKIILNF